MEGEGPGEGSQVHSNAVTASSSSNGSFGLLGGVHWPQGLFLNPLLSGTA